MMVLFMWSLYLRSPKRSQGGRDLVLKEINSGKKMNKVFGLSPLELLEFYREWGPKAEENWLIETLHCSKQRFVFQAEKHDQAPHM